MKDLEQLKLERASLESIQQLLIKENLESRELKEEKITELNIVKKEIDGVDKSIALLRKKIDFQLFHHQILHHLIYQRNQ
jgi:hypothetical protein